MARKRIKDVITKPSEAIQAMIDGLRKQSQRSDFQVNMMTYGARGSKHGAYANICYGCAATCTVQELAHIDLSCDVIGSKERRAKALGFKLLDQLQFEYVIDLVRRGNMSELFVYFDISLQEAHRFIDAWLPTLVDTNWEKDLKYYEQYVRKLQKAGY